MITFSHVSVETTDGARLDDITLEIEPGDCVCITGASSAGKTLLLQLLLGEKKPTKGKVSVDKVDLSVLPPHLLRLYRRNIGVMFGEEQLLPDRSIASNIALALEARSESPDETALRVTELLEKIGLIEKLAFLPASLTQEEKHLVAFAQALAHKPTILLADEPLANINPESAKTILDLLQEERKKGTTIVITTCTPQSFSALHARTIHLDHGKIAMQKQKITAASGLQSISPSRV